MKISSVRLRLALWNIGILALVLFGFLLFVHLSVRSYLLSAVDQRLTDIAERSSQFIAQNPAPRIAPPRDTRFRIVGRRRERLVHIYNLKGKQITLFGTAATIQEPPWDKSAFNQAAHGYSLFSMITEDGDPLRVYSRPVIRDSKQIAVIQAVNSFSEIEALLGKLTVTLIWLIPVALIIAGFGGLFLTSRALSPVRQIVDAANSLNTDDLSKRLPVIGADEFAHLAVTINRLLSRLEETFIKLRKAINRERHFTSDASHELRTPLTVIKANASLALTGERKPAQYREALTQINQSADIMNRLVQDLLLLARSDSGQLTLSFTPVDPHNLFDEAVALIGNSPNHAKIDIQMPDASLMIWGDPEHLRRLVLNLLENALRHTPPDGEITMKASQGDNRVIIVIIDTGEGIAAEHLSHLFDRFYRVDPARSRVSGGSGLGLAICKSIVDAHGGSLVIDSVLGKGTSVTVTLPMKQLLPESS